MLRTRASFASARSHQRLVSFEQLCRTNTASQPSPDPLGQHTHLQNNAHWPRLQRKFRIKFSFLGNGQHLECSVQDSHFWSSIVKAPQKPSIKLPKITHISHFFKLSNSKLLTIPTSLFPVPHFPIQADAVGSLSESERRRDGETTV